MLLPSHNMCMKTSGFEGTKTSSSFLISTSLPRWQIKKKIIFMVSKSKVLVSKWYISQLKLWCDRDAK